MERIYKQMNFKILDVDYSYSKGSRKNQPERSDRVD